MKASVFTLILSMAVHVWAGPNVVAQSPAYEKLSCVAVDGNVKASMDIFLDVGDMSIYFERADIGTMTDGSIYDVKVTWAVESMTATNEYTTLKVVLQKDSKNKLTIFLPMGDEGIALAKTGNHYAPFKAGAVGIVNNEIFSSTFTCVDPQAPKL